MRPKQLFAVKSSVANALSKLYDKPQIRKQLPGHLTPHDLEAMDSVSANLSSSLRGASAIGFVRRIERLLGAIDQGEDEFKALANAYAYAKQQLLPLTNSHTELAQLINTAGSDFQLFSVSLEETREIDVAASGDPSAAQFRGELLARVDIALRATDANKAQAIGQLIETLEELRTYILLKSKLTSIEKIPETNTSTPDFRAEFNGLEFFLELKVPDIVGGQGAHRSAFAGAVDAKIEAEKQAEGGGIGFSYQLHTPYGPGGAEKPTLVQIETINSRVRGMFKVEQFQGGPTVGLMSFTRLPLANPDIALRRCVNEEDGRPASGTLWNAGFAPVGTEIFGPGGSEGKTTSHSFFRDPGYRFPGIAFVSFHRLMHTRSTSTLGLMNQAGGNIGGWSRRNIADLLDLLCDDWADEDD